MCKREELRRKLTWVSVIQEGFLVEGVPQPNPGEEQAVDRWMREGQHLVGGCGSGKGAGRVKPIPCWRWQCGGLRPPWTLLEHNKTGLGAGEGAEWGSFKGGFSLLHPEGLEVSVSRLERGEGTVASC